MSDPTFSDIDFKIKWLGSELPLKIVMVRVSTPLKEKKTKFFMVRVLGRFLDRLYLIALFDHLDNLKGLSGL